MSFQYMLKSNQFPDRIKRFYNIKIIRTEEYKNIKVEKLKVQSGK